MNKAIGFMMSYRYNTKFSSLFSKQVFSIQKGEFATQILGG